MRTSLEGIFNTVNAAWDADDFQLTNILNNYRIDQNDLPLLSDRLINAIKSGQSLFCLDASGLATHTFGLAFINQMQSSLEDGQLLWLPYAALTEIPLADDQNPSLNDLVALTDPSMVLEASKKTVVIVTGVDYLNINKTQRSQAFESLSEAWSEILEGTTCLVFGNYVADEFTRLDQVKITLPPLYLNMQYTIQDSYAMESVTFPAELLVNQISAHTQDAFRYCQDQPDGVFTISKAMLTSYLKKETSIIREKREEVIHAPELFSIQDIVKLLLGEPASSGSVLATVPRLDTPSKWYYAALSAAQVHQSDPSKVFFLYRVAGHLMARRMVKRIHYVSDLGPIENFASIDIDNADQFNQQEIQWILRSLKELPDYDNLNSDSISKTLKKIRGSWKREKIKSLRECNKKIPKGGPQWSEKVESIFRTLTDLLKSDYTDNNITQAINELGPEAADPSYQLLQQELNQRDEATISRGMLSVLNGKASADNDVACRTILTANLLAESARCVHAFFSPFAMLALIQQQTGVKLSWQRYVSLPARLDIGMEEASWADKITADILDALGGLHPMAHNGSFFQVQPEYSRGGVAPEFGITWVTLKCQILYARWLVSSLQACKFGITLDDHQFSFSTSPNHRLLSAADAQFISRDFELLLRMELAYNIHHEDQDILVKADRPFETVNQLIADPQQIKLMPCGKEGEFGYYLVINKSGESGVEQHFFHLDMYQTYFIATKLDAIGDPDRSLPLFNYLCRRHPLNLAIRYARALLLIFHPDLMRSKELYHPAQSDLDFLTRHKTVEGSLKDQVDYLGAVYSFRFSAEPGEQALKCNRLMMPILQGSIKKGLEIVNRFDRTDEEYPRIRLLIADTYRRLMHVVKDDAIANNNLASERGVAVYSYYLLSFTYAIFYALTVHRTIENERRFLADIFNELVRKGGSIFFSSVSIKVNLPVEARAILKEDEIDHPVKTLSDVFLQCVNAFSPYMKDQKLEVQDHIKNLESSPAPSNARKAKKQILGKLVNMLRNNFKHAIINNKGCLGLLIQLNWKVPFGILTAYAQHLGLSSALVCDEQWGSCFYAEFNEKLNNRACYQPTPHPDSFLIKDYKEVRYSQCQFVAKMKQLFNDCISLVKQWKPTESQRVSYHLFGNPTLLPSLIFITQRKDIMDCLIKLPNGLPVGIILDWLKHYNFAFHWVNSQQHGRCICVTAINVVPDNQHDQRASANGQILQKLKLHLAKENNYSRDEKKSANTTRLFRLKNPVVSIAGVSLSQEDYLAALRAERLHYMKKSSDKKMSRSKQQRSRKKSKQRINKNFTITECGAGGDCLFKVIASGLEIDHRQLRTLIHRALVNDKANLQPVIETEGCDIQLQTAAGRKRIDCFSQYCRLMKSSGTWGGEVEIMLASKIIKRPIVVVPAGISEKNSARRYLPGGQYDSEPPLFMLYTGNHYQLLTVRDTIGLNHLLAELFPPEKHWALVGRQL